MGESLVGSKEKVRRKGRTMVLLLCTAYEDELSTNAVTRGHVGVTCLGINWSLVAAVYVKNILERGKQITPLLSHSVRSPFCLCKASGHHHPIIRVITIPTTTAVSPFFLSRANNYTTPPQRWLPRSSSLQWK